VRAVGRGVRALHSAAPTLQRYVPLPRTYLPRLGAFGLADCRKSIETSLRELRTDYLDVLLLHECSPSNVEGPELVSWLLDLKREGRVRAIGTATGIEETISILSVHPELSEVVQIPSAIWNLNIEKLQTEDCGLVITHSSITGRLNSLLGQLAADEAMAADWRSMTGVDTRDVRGFSQLLLAHALHSNPAGVVVFFSSKPSHIVENVNQVKEPTIDESQIKGLNELLSRKNVRAFLDSAVKA
jgi:aryl-alcohol dehydrogenase-like predicted oxidoreductase